MAQTLVWRMTEKGRHLSKLRLSQKIGGALQQLKKKKEPLSFSPPPPSSVPGEVGLSKLCGCSRSLKVGFG